MTGLVLKLSYNNIGETPVIGGITGSFFFIENNIVVTANHVLNKKDFTPNEGFKYCQFWLLIEPNIVIEVSLEKLIEFPDIDSTIIKLEEKYQIPVRTISNTSIEVGKYCFNEGFIGGQMPRIMANWNDEKLVITGCYYNNTKALGEGFVKSIKVMTVNAADIKMENVLGIETSYGGIQGMSGGPLIDRITNQIVGLMSIGYPEDVQIKQSLFAIEIQQLIERLNVA
ncbi:Trypsin-like peptidase domain-containing protein [Flavobacterium fluvii]|uniref:Trypsin-like peptidase domain-containing protein n=1 Tax=Flavobacterium fluvii TaxID=468056 RepID=A0A1M5JRF0_9FLAO|nr:trypsin-like peptidase domain-containing protein [Flavobacterium fluvii]SHG42849.1 Trypsin-like peptidase domain-containing protein [Flavobacterium fluvii]